MKVGIHKERNGKITDFIRRYETILLHNNIDVEWLEAGDPDFWQRLKEVDFFVFRWNLADDLKQIASSVIPVIDNHLNIPCFPDTTTCWAYDDKIRESYMLSAAGFESVKTFIFYNKTVAESWLRKNNGWPLVFKLKGGASSRNVMLVKNYRQAIKLVRKNFGRGIHPNDIFTPGTLFWKEFSPRTFAKRILSGLAQRIFQIDLTIFWALDKNYVLFQEFLPGNTYDTRVVIIGKRAFAFRRYNRKNDWRASGSHLPDTDPSLVDLNMLKIAFRVSDKLHFQSMAYDFLYNQSNEPVICEMSYIYPDSTIVKCPGYWDDNLQFHPGRFWPQYFHLVDLLKFPELKQPDFNDDIHQEH